ncbi:uncharacterized protein LOC120356964 [Solenopsis invicta]|uniref:uncharacterized protein LOC120356964 n=1 Tax=Solenopsis invicta TaxID=13686 RepID=UPI00193DACAF|nr:uncharacterized protein LOC120356964 [Solenopsis invicta]
MRECKKMKELLLQLITHAKNENVMGSHFIISELDDFIVDHKLSELFDKHIVGPPLFYAWAEEFMKYWKDRNDIRNEAFCRQSGIANSTAATSDIVKSHEKVVLKGGKDDADDENDDDDDEIDDNADNGRATVSEIEAACNKGASGGVDLLFNFNTKNSGVEQYIAKVEDGLCYTARLLRETGERLICIDVYDVQDITGKSRRHWWKKARVKSQFLAPSREDMNLRMVKKVLNVAPDNLKKSSYYNKRTQR